MRWTILCVVAATTLVGCGDERAVDPDLGSTSDGITLNTSSWTGGEGEAWMEAGIAGVVRIDATGCVYLGSPTSNVVRDIAWPAGYTASRQTDESVAIRNADGVVVAATGRRVDFGGGTIPGVKLECRAQGPRARIEPGDSGVVMVTDVLPPLDD
ncbi:MAG: hypothetical protein ACRDPQ_18490 [Nocardioidaceae bacterium]